MLLGPNVAVLGQVKLPHPRWFVLGLVDLHVVEVRTAGALGVNLPEGSRGVAAAGQLLIAVVAVRGGIGREEGGLFVEVADNGFGRNLEFALFGLILVVVPLAH